MRLTGPQKAYRLFMAHPATQFIAVPMGVRTLIVAITVEAAASRWFKHSFTRFPATRVSNGTQSGPRIGIQKGPFFGIGSGLSR